ncbi:MAG: polysaccharide biosynthesis tyrosine autokinase [Gammaproteobacteria bacterium]|nr:polysaccharide biosynthesis tyrosine autokinase [Gammaproteobacteria bacterium]
MTALNLQQENKKNDEIIDIATLFRVILLNKLLIGVSVLFFVFAAVLYLRVTQPVYSVNGLVQVESNRSVVDGLLGGSGLSTLANLADVKSPADTEIQLLKSRFILGDVVRNLNLDIVLFSDKDRWYRRLLHPVAAKLDYAKDGVRYTTAEQVVEIRKFNLPDALLNQTFKLNFLTDGRYTLELLNKSEIPGFENQAVIVGSVGHLLTQSMGDGTLQLLVQKSTSNPTLDSMYLTKRNLFRAVQNIDDNLFITEQGKQTGILALIYKGVNQDSIQQTLNEVMRSYLAQNVANRTEDTQQTLKFLDDQLPQLRADLESSEDRYNQFREKNKTIDPEKEAALLLQQSVELKTKRVELEQQATLLGQKYTANFPQMLQVKAQLAALDQDDKTLELRVQAMPELQRKYLQLYRDVQVNTVLYTNLLNSYQQLKVLKAGKTATARVLEQAIKSDNLIKPKKALVLLLSVILGVVVGVILVIFKNLFSAGVKDIAEIEAKTGVSVVATVPRSLYQRRMFRHHDEQRIGLIAADDLEDLAVESLRSLRTVVHFSVVKARNNIILFTGPSPEIGKTFVSANFAAVCAQMGKSVVLIDGDIRRGHLNKYFNVGKVQGLADYLGQDDVQLDHVCNPTSITGLSLITKGSAPSNPSELLLTGRFNTMMSTLSEKYDYVIIDSPPILAAADAAIIARMAGMVFMVVRYAQTHVRELELSLARLSQAGASVEGIVLNDIQRGKSYGYDYQYSYQYRTRK